MQVGDIVTMRYFDSTKRRPKGIVVAVDPEEINDEEEVAVLWTSVWCDEANHSVAMLEVISASR